jgi:lipopolysaccharide/colanic/teichoic acid biosynthesis glycosyltransferase
VLLSPLLAIIWFGIRLDSRGAAIFKAQRVGKHGQVFTMYKFRTMCVDAEARLVQIAHLRQGGPYMIKIPSDPRVTRFGRFLRRTSLDELPQLWNVVKGEMSLVGPRPQAPDEVALYNSRQRCRLEVTPGITGLWQVTARDIPDFEEWIRLDLQYIAGWSLWLDFKILLRTFGEVAGK